MLTTNWNKQEKVQLIFECPSCFGSTVTVTARDCGLSNLEVSQHPLCPAARSLSASVIAGFLRAGFRL